MSDKTDTTTKQDQKTLEEIHEQKYKQRQEQIRPDAPKHVIKLTLKELRRLTAYAVEHGDGPAKKITVTCTVEDCGFTVYPIVRAISDTGPVVDVTDWEHF